MRGEPGRPWSKFVLDELTGQLAWHPLEDHCADVAAVCERLLKSTLIRLRLARLAGVPELDEVACARLCVLAALHDAGKANHGFQRKAEPAQPDVAGHVTPFIDALFSRDPSLRRTLLDALRLDLLRAWGAESLLLAAIAHHGRPPSLGSAGLNARPALWRAVGGIDPIAAIAALTTRALQWFPLASTGSPPLPESPALSHAFAGLVTWADWLASDRSLFPFSEEGDPDRIEKARLLAEAALHRTWLDPRPLRQALGPGFEWSRAFSFPPNPAQRALLGQEIPSGGGIVILEAETGSGKTEASLAWFMKLLGSGEVDGLYFALPTRSAAVQIHRRVLAACARVFGDDAPPVILAVPGYACVGPDGLATVGPALCRPEELWPDDGAERSRWRTWAGENSKRYLTGIVSVGTVDQVLLGALQVPHAHLRSGALLRQLLVVDEVHASDAYMNVLLEEILSRHLAAGGHALLMSATLGGAVRSRLGGGSRRAPDLQVSLSVPYPALTVAPARGPGPPAVRSIEPDKGRARSVALRPEPFARDPGTVAALALDAAREGARVVVLRNLVSDALATQLAVEASAEPNETRLLFRCAGRPAPHHSRFSPEDRRLLDSELERALGRAGPAGGLIVVATQTVQQSLDLDCDLLVTDLCPIDVLLQRLGRLHRHQRERPGSFRSAQAVVLQPADALGTFIQKSGKAQGPCGIGTVYSDLRQLEATRRLVAERSPFAIPEMNRELVELATHPTALDAIASAGGSSWLAHAATCLGEGLASQNLGHLSTFTWENPYQDTPFAPDVSAMATTRLGADDRLARFEPPLASPFGDQFSSLSVPSWLVRGAGEDELPQVLKTDVSAGWVRFRFGETVFEYDRLGLRRGSEEEVTEAKTNA